MGPKRPTCKQSKQSNQAKQAKQTIKARSDVHGSQDGIFYNPIFSPILQPTRFFDVDPAVDEDLLLTVDIIYIQGRHSAELK